jgi:signal transduction histidine kinase
VQYLSILFLIFTSIVVYKNPKSQTSRFILLVIFGWFLSPYGFILYLDRNNIYSLSVNRYFNLPYSWWNQIALLNPDQINLIRLMNFGILLFVYAFACYAVAFTNVRNVQKNTRYYLLLLLIPVLEFLIYDPTIYKALYLLLIYGNKSLLSYNQFDTMVQIVYNTTRFVNIGYLLGSILLLVIYLKRRNHLPFLRNYTLFVLLGFLPVIILFLLTFAWAPKELMAVSALANYVSFNVVDLSDKYWLSVAFRYMVIGAFPVIIYATWKYGTLEVSYQKQENSITKSINIAHLGARVFSHALKNQIIAIQGETEFLQSKLPGQTEIQESIKTIQSTCETMIARLNELYNRFHSIELELLPTALNQGCGEAIQNFARTIPPQITFNYRPAADDPCVYLDARHFQEVIAVLFNNALEAIGEQAGTIEVAISNAGNWGIVTIADTGVGMATEQLKHIFEPFYTTKSSSQNWGIGLSYVHKIITGHNGKIFVESKAGHGSAFKLAFPKIR